MVAGLHIPILLALVGLFLLICVLASKASSRMGVPALVLFLGLGMLVGSDGPGGVHFDNMALTANVGTVALALILFSGGLDSDWSSIRPIVWRGLSMATIGIAVTAFAVGLFAFFFLGFTLLEGMLLGAVVSSTDAAAVFGVLRGRSVRLKHRLTPLLEFESGTNDPLAVFLTMALVGLLVGPASNPWALIPEFLLQMPLGLLVGYLCGLAAAWIVNHIRLDYDGLYPAISISCAFLAFGVADAVYGNEFLAVYVAGVTLGSRNLIHRLAIKQFHDAIGWLMQIAMFVLLGLLVFPSKLALVWLPALVTAGFLVLVARPLAVFASLALAKMPVRSKLFLSWAGLRGAVPIILATFPHTAGVAKADTIFNVVFFVVLVSVLLQGSLLPRVGRALGVVATSPQEPRCLRRAATEDLLEIVLPPDARSVGKQVVELGLPQTALIVLLKREGVSYIPRGGTVLEPGDVLLVATRQEDREELRSRLAS